MKRPDPRKLRLLADWLDMDDVSKSLRDGKPRGDQVQRDLREWADWCDPPQEPPQLYDWEADEELILWDTFRVKLTDVADPGVVLVESKLPRPVDLHEGDSFTITHTITLDEPPEQPPDFTRPEHFVTLGFQERLRDAEEAAFIRGDCSAAIQQRARAEREASVEYGDSVKPWRPPAGHVLGQRDPGEPK